MFANISNHAVVNWETAQLTAAEALGGHVVDVRFPSVDPLADEDTVAQLAASVFDALPVGVTCAMVMGEFTLTLELVDLLQSNGVRCFAATTARRTGANGERLFTFCKFREYLGRFGGEVLR